ncbi:prion-like-(Q/N-rich) domain-bearing protein 25 [Littorina saxatilis]|uniref:Uncharacterized protein n=1 Tax=Littorina saxatilis TaxID=31220 RepID=A0AAN9B5F8_9CAEN
MKSVYLSSFVLLIWVAGSLAADGDAGGKCVGDNNSCTDANAYCDDSDTRNKVCSCKAGWVRKGSKCVRGANQPCGPSECMAFGACNDGVCGCDASLGRVLLTGSADNSSCVCPENQVMGGKDGKCLKTIGQPCTADTECITDAVCNAETKKCECDSAKFFGTAKDNATWCPCNLTKTIQRTAGITKCLLKFGQECTSTSECKAGDGVICDQTCKCDTTKNYEMNEPSSACQCAADHTKRSDKTCGKNVNQDCAAGDVCTDHANCNSNGKCVCDIANFWSTNTGNTCYCNDGPDFKTKADGSCGRNLDKTCARDSQCLDHAICSLDTTTNTNKCTCDASKFREKIGDINECACNENTIQDSNDKMCRKKVGQPCNDVSECVTTHGMVCKEVDKTKICTCDTTKHFAAGTAGDTTCSCADGDMYHLQMADGSCAIKVGKNCSSADAFCVPGAVCDKKSQLCLCDSTNNYATGSVGDTKCSCDANSEQIPGTHFCGETIIIGGNCTAKTDVCTDHATCTMDMESGTSSCKCSGKTMLDGSCSVASPVVASFGVLMAGLLMTSRLI